MALAMLLLFQVENEPGPMRSAPEMLFDAGSLAY
jgi:hypothetical protein